MTIDNIKEEIEKAKNIVILTHECPDGDAVGSALAMYLTLNTETCTFSKVSLTF